MIWLIILGVSALLLFLYFKFFKLYKPKNIVFVDGALGTGKSFLCVALAVRLYKRAVRRWKVYKIVCKAMRAIGRLFKKDRLIIKFKEPEKPLLYSNIKLRNVDFVKLTKEVLYRQKRIAYKSVVLIDEFSLIADQMQYKDKEINERLSEFFKLFRHESRGGHIIVNSQTTSDLHFSLKYCLSDYLYIHHRTNLPFVCALSVQEMAYVADKDGQAVVNVRTNDIESTCKVMLQWKKYFRYYDSYCYSALTDGLEVSSILQRYDRGDSLKDYDLLTLKQYHFLFEHLGDMKK